MAAAIVLSEKMSPHDATLRLVVRIVDPFLVAAGDDLEQGSGVLGRHGQIAEFVDDEHCRAGEEPHGGSPAAFEGGCCGIGLLGQRRWCSKPDAHRRPRHGPG